jgi:serine/threonine protein kinase
VTLLTKIEHKNLVQLLGYVDQGNERIIITEYVPNGTLREHLDGMQLDSMLAYLIHPQVLRCGNWTSPILVLLVPASYAIV